MARLEERVDLNTWPCKSRKTVVKSSIQTQTSVFSIPLHWQARCQVVFRLGKWMALLPASIGESYSQTIPLILLLMTFPHIWTPSINKENWNIFRTLTLCLPSSKLENKSLLVNLLKHFFHWGCPPFLIPDGRWTRRMSCSWKWVHRQRWVQVTHILNTIYIKIDSCKF